MSEPPIPYLAGSSVPVPHASCVMPDVCPVVRFGDAAWRQTVHAERRRWHAGGDLVELLGLARELTRRLELALEDFRRPDDGPDRPQAC